MSNKTTNQKKGIVTRGSGHIAESSDVSLPYFEKLLTGLVMDDNHIETSKCSVGQAARRTFIAGHNVIHHESKIGIPFGTGASTYDRPHSVAKNTPPAFKFFAESTENSPDTKVEGNWVVRTFDKTVQDGGNGPGKFSPGPGSTEIVDEDELLFQQCAVEKIKLECPYTDDDGNEIIRETVEGELHVYIGDKVKVTAYRVNASETDPEKRLDVVCYITRMRAKKNPPAEETRHAAFVLTRNGRNIAAAIMGSSWSEIKNKTLVGENSSIAVEGSEKKAKISVLELKEDWLLEADDTNASIGPIGGDYESNDRRQDGKAIAHAHAGPARDQVRAERRADRANSQVQQARSQSRRGNAKPGAISRAESNRRDANRDLARHNEQAPGRAAERSANADASNSIQSNARLILDSWAIVQEVWLFKPLRIDIEAHGCSPGANAVVQAYPSETYGAELAALADFPGRKTLDAIKSLITTMKDFFAKIKGGRVREIGKALGADPQLYEKTGFNIDLYFFRHKKSSTAGNSSSDEDLAPSIELGLQWKLLTRDSSGADEIKGRKAWQAHVAWGVDVKLERLLGLAIQCEVDLNACLGFGKFIADALKFVGVKTGIFLDINVGLSVGIGGTVERDEYGKWDLSSPNVPVKSVIQLSLVLKAGRFFEAAFRITGRWEPKFSLGKNDKGQVCLMRTKASFDIVLTAEVKVDLLGWDFDLTYEIHKWPINVDGTAIPILGDGK